MTLIIGAGILLMAVTFLMLKLGEKEENEHFFLQLLLFGVIFGLVLVIGKASFDEKDYCSWNIANSTIIDASTTSYGWMYQCETNTTNTASVFYGIITWFVRIVAGYLVFYTLWKMFFRKLIMDTTWFKK